MLDTVSLWLCGSLALWLCAPLALYVFSAPLPLCPFVSWASQNFNLTPNWSCHRDRRSSRVNLLKVDDVMPLML